MKRENALYFRTICPGDRISGHREHIMYILTGKTKQQRFCRIDIAVPTCHMRDRIDTQLTPKLRCEHRTIRVRTGNRAIRDRDRIHAVTLQHPCTIHKLCK